ncbi:transporter [Haloarculaceae archaeon H-GB2-1]|nr:transporter [Haloarculaceae archaeon H-GB1-1]MEA5387399.1 transporter [Haloarculaceae archaeon H-GB11]MEA5408872.1 transporter [Haloarculaceae archaeon H-GB2-1]
MSLATSASYTLHLLFAGLWTGSVLFVTYGILPSARAGDLNAAPLEAITGKLKTVSRTSAVLLFLTGGHMAGTAYTVETLTGTSPGHLVLTMLALWAVLMGLVEVGAAKLTSGAGQKKVRSPATEAAPFFKGAAVVAILLLIDAGLLAGGGI